MPFRDGKIEQTLQTSAAYWLAKKIQLKRTIKLRPYIKFFRLFARHFSQIFVLKQF